MLIGTEKQKILVVDGAVVQFRIKDWGENWKCHAFIQRFCDNRFCDNPCLDFFRSVYSYCFVEKVSLKIRKVLCLNETIKERKSTLSKELDSRSLCSESYGSHGQIPAVSLIWL